jgi:hypothetical protein
MSTESTGYRPRGRMCVLCDHRKQDCRSLPFSMMRPIGKDADGSIVVICTYYERTEPPKKAGT